MGKIEFKIGEVDCASNQVETCLWELNPTMLYWEGTEPEDYCLKADRFNRVFIIYNQGSQGELRVNVPEKYRPLTSEHRTDFKIGSLEYSVIHSPTTKEDLPDLLK